MDVLTIIFVAGGIAAYLSLRTLDGFLHRLGAHLADRCVQRFRR